MTSIGKLHAKKMDKVVLLYVFAIAFPASPLRKLRHGCFKNQNIHIFYIFFYSVNTLCTLRKVHEADITF